MLMNKTLLVTLLSTGLLVTSANIQATAIANSNLAFSDLVITPQTGTLELLIDWELEAFAEAKNSLGEIDQAFDSSFFGGSVAADAAVTWASGHGAADAPTFFPPDFSVSGNAASDVNLPGCEPKWANSLGRGTFVNGFSITGGTGSVDVDFSANLMGALEVWTDECGILAQTEVIFTFEIFDLLPLSGGSSQEQLIWSEREILSVGPNSHQDNIVSESLTASRLLNFDTDYFFVIEVDSESRAIVPEPPVLMLMLGAVVMLCRQGKRTRVKNASKDKQL